MATATTMLLRLIKMAMGICLYMPCSRPPLQGTDLPRLRLAVSLPDVMHLLLRPDCKSLPYEIAHDVRQADTFLAVVTVRVLLLDTVPALALAVAQVPYRSKALRLEDELD